LTQKEWLDDANSSAEFKFHSLYDQHMPLIQISAYPGRTKEQKEAFAKAITNAAVEILNAKPQHVIITYDERPSENWYISGEQL
jgi:4-oxalocrotonate tautomerase